MKKLLIFILLLGFLGCQSDEPQPVKDPVKKSTDQTPPSGSGSGGSGSSGGGSSGGGNNGNSGGGGV